MTEDKSIHYNIKSKHFFVYLPIIELHFFTDDKDDKEIKLEINKYLTMIKMNLKIKLLSNALLN